MQYKPFYPGYLITSLVELVSHWELESTLLECPQEPSVETSQCCLELASFSNQGLAAKLATDLLGFLMYVKDTVDMPIVSAVCGWESRVILLLHLFSIT